MLVRLIQFVFVQLCHQIYLTELIFRSLEGAYLSVSGLNISRFLVAQGLKETLETKFPIMQLNSIFH